MSETATSQVECEGAGGGGGELLGQEGNLGLTLGERKIGVRLAQPEGPVCLRRTWQVSGVSKECQELQPMEVLEEAGMLTLEF